MDAGPYNTDHYILRVIPHGPSGTPVPTRCDLLFFRAPSGRELPTESGEGEGEQLGNYLAIVSNLKQGVCVILSGTEWSRRIS